MNDVINHLVLVVVTSERADRCVARLLCVHACVCMCGKKTKSELGRRGRPPRRGKISISIIESRLIARTPRGAKHVPRSRAPGFFHRLSGLITTRTRGMDRGSLILRRDTCARVSGVYLISRCDNCEAKKSRNRDNCDFNWKIVYIQIRDNSC